MDWMNCYPQQTLVFYERVYRIALEQQGFTVASVINLKEKTALTGEEDGIPARPG